MDMQSLSDLYVEELRDLYNAENQILKALPKMAAAAQNEDLVAAFEEHADQTKVQVERLEKIFHKLNTSPKGHKCAAMEGIIEECKELMEKDADPDVMDAGLIGMAQKVEHYEIAGYGTARTFAKMLGHNDAVKLLQQTLEEEGDTDKKLTMLAESAINKDAMDAAN